MKALRSRLHWIARNQLGLFRPSRIPPDTHFPHRSGRRISPEFEFGPRFSSAHLGIGQAITIFILLKLVQMLALSGDCLPLCN